MIRVLVRLGGSHTKLHGDYKVFIIAKNSDHKTTRFSGFWGLRTSGVPETRTMQQFRKWEFPKLRVPYLGILIIGILLFRVLY